MSHMEVAQRGRASATAPRRAGMRLRRQESLYGYLFLSPWLIGLLLFSIGPIMASFALIFADYSGFRRIEFAGLENIREMLFHDIRFLDALKVSATYAFWHVLLTLTFGLALAMLLNRNFRGRSLFRTLCYLPAAVSGVAMFYVWYAVLHREFGAFNQVLRMAGLPRIGWLVSVEWALPSYILMSLWGVGRPMVILLAGLQAIPDHLYDAAKIDGCNNVRLFRHVTLPMLSPTIFFLMITGIIGSLQVFAAGFMLTQGGPVRSTLFYVLHLYNTAYVDRRFGYASALAWFLFLVILGLTLLQFLAGRYWVHYETEVSK